MWNTSSFAKSIDWLKPFGFTAICCWSFPANAIVSMEDIHLGKPPEGFQGAFELSLELDNGNTEEKGAAAGLKLQWTEGQRTDFILTSYEYGESSGVRDKNKGFTHLRHIQQFDPSYAWEAFGQISFDEFTDLEMRALLGGGLRLTLSQSSKSYITHLGLGAFYEYEKLDTDASGEDTEHSIRANTYLVYKYQFNDNVSLVNSTYYQPDLEDFSDYRAIENLSVVSKLSNDLSLSVGINIRYDSEPPPDVNTTDTSLKVGIGIKF